MDSLGISVVVLVVCRPLALCSTWNEDSSRVHEPSPASADADVGRASRIVVELI